PLRIPASGWTISLFHSRGPGRLRTPARSRTTLCGLAQPKRFALSGPRRAIRALVVLTWFERLLEQQSEQTVIFARIQEAVCAKGEMLNLRRARTLEELTPE